MQALKCYEYSLQHTPLAAFTISSAAFDMAVHRLDFINDTELHKDLETALRHTELSPRLVFASMSGKFGNRFNPNKPVGCCYHNHEDGSSCATPKIETPEV